MYLRFSLIFFVLLDLVLIGNALKCYECKKDNKMVLCEKDKQGDLNDCPADMTEPNCHFDFNDDGES